MMKVDEFMNTFGAIDDTQQALIKETQQRLKRRLNAIDTERYIVSNVNAEHVDKQERSEKPDSKNKFSSRAELKQGIQSIYRVEDASP